MPPNFPPSLRTPPRQRAIVYGRVSSSLQKNRGNLDRQLAELHQYCHHHNYQLIKTLQDVGSGLSFPINFKIISFSFTINILLFNSSLGKKLVPSGGSLKIYSYIKFY
ncbi:MAG: recombinase family protein [Candidatus Helarchaeota archaeon]